jgi:hypothetical protein
MKSLNEAPFDFERELVEGVVDKCYTGTLIAHLELYRKVSQLEGSVVKCGVTTGGFTKFAMLTKLMAVKSIQSVIAFEKTPKRMTVPCTKKQFNFQNPKCQTCFLSEYTSKKAGEKEIVEDVDFVTGNISDSIPHYLMENPEMKIAYLNIDFDEYESTLTVLQFFYPRLVHGGVLILDNYYKKEEDYEAVTDYFKYVDHKIYNFSVNKGPDYLIRS